MEIEKIKFKKQGSPLSIEIKTGYAQPGVYSVMLWEAGKNVVVASYKGNFINTDDDKYVLPEPVELNNGRLVDCVGDFVITAPINDYSLEVIVLQDGDELGKASYAGNADAQTASVKLLVMLEGE